MFFQAVQEEGDLCRIGEFCLEREQAHILHQVLHRDIQHGDMEIVEDPHHADDIPLPAGDLQFDPDLVDIL